MTKDLFERRVEWAVAKTNGPEAYGIPELPPELPFEAERTWDLGR